MDRYTEYLELLKNVKGLSEEQQREAAAFIYGMSSGNKQTKAS